MHPAASALLALALLSPPSGRPPMGPLERYAPRVYDLRYEVTLNTMIPYGQDDPRNHQPLEKRNPRYVEYGGTFHLEDTPIVMPLVFNGSYHQIDQQSVRGELWLGSARDAGLPSRFRIESGLPHHSHLAILPITRFDGKIIRWNVQYRLQSFSARLDDKAAATVPWPREWPEEVADGLAPQMYIESDKPLFAETVTRITNGELRLVTPYVAAKNIVRYCIEQLNLSGNGLIRGRLGVLHGMDVKGALAAATDGLGGPNDLVCVCVAMLRAAGIPARPVIGVGEDDKGRTAFVVWAEFYLPNAGWVPFDPVAMRGKGVRSRDVSQPWPEFGTMDDLNRRVPLAYHFIPPRAVESPMCPAVWGWDPRPSGAPDAEQIIQITISSRGLGTPDPE